MPDKFSQGAFDDRNWIEKITESIPLYSGYQNRDRRRETDKLLRSFISDQINEVNQTIKKVALFLTDSGIIQPLQKIDRIWAEMEYLRDKIRIASYGYSGFFDTLKINEDVIEVLYKCDLEVLEKVKALKKLIQTPAASNFDKPDQISSQINKWAEEVENLKQKILERDSIIIKSKGL